MRIIKRLSIDALLIILSLFFSLPHLVNIADTVIDHAISAALVAAWTAVILIFVNKLDEHLHGDS